MDKTSVWKYLDVQGYKGIEWGYIAGPLLKVC